MHRPLDRHFTDVCASATRKLWSTTRTKTRSALCLHPHSSCENRCKFVPFRLSRKFSLFTHFVIPRLISLSFIDICRRWLAMVVRPTTIYKYINFRPLDIHDPKSQLSPWCPWYWRAARLHGTPEKQRAAAPGHLPSSNTSGVPDSFCFRNGPRNFPAIWYRREGG